MEQILDEEGQVWMPRQILRRTNWLYRIDSLRPHDIREMNVIWDLVCILKHYAIQYIIWAHVLLDQIRNTVDESTRTELNKVIDLVIPMATLLWSESYCYFLDFLDIAYYPVTNRFTTNNDGPRFPPIDCNSIALLGFTECRDMTGFSKEQVMKLKLHLRIPDTIVYPGRMRFSGEEALLYYLYWNRNGGTKLQMSTNKFGGDPRRFTYAIRLVCNHIYTNFYHKVSGNSMQQWLPQIQTFRRAIWQRLIQTATRERDSDGVRYINIHMPLDQFRIFGMLDDTGFRTTAPGRQARRQLGFIDDVQRAFYSAYFAGHGLKAQVLTLPNGLIGSIYLASWRVSDAGVLNLSGLDHYLQDLFTTHGAQRFMTTNGQLPAVFGDGIFPNRATIVARQVRDDEGVSRRINTLMSSVRQSIEHIFGLHHNVFALFRDPQRFKLLVHGEEASKLIFNSFLLLNCYNIFHSSSNHFLVSPPSIEEYLPLDEDLILAPEVTDDELGNVYNYGTR